MVETKINWKSVILYGLILGAIILLVLYLWHKEPIYGFGNTILAWIGGFFSNPSLAPAVTFIKANWAPISAVALPVGGALVAAVVNQIRVNNEVKAKEELPAGLKDTTSDLTSKSVALTDANSQIDSLTQQLAKYEGDTTSTDLQTRLSQVLREKEVSDAANQGQIDALTQTIKELKVTEKIVVK